MGASNGYLLFSPTLEQSILMWTAMLANYCTRQSKDQILYTLPGCEASALAYRFSETVPETATDAPGIIDASTYRRKDTAVLVEEFLKWLADNRKVFFESHGDFLILAFIGTKPEMQGKGYGNLILNHLDDMADELGLWTYLEASSQSSRRLYARHGYEDIGFKAWRPQEYGVDLENHMDIFLMARPPRAGKGKEQ